MVNDGGIMRTSSSCAGRWKPTPAVCRCHPHLHRRITMEIALYARVSTSRQQQTQTIDQQLDRLRVHVAQQQDWHLAEEHIYRMDGFSAARPNRPGLDRLGARAGFAAFERGLTTDPIAWRA